jgi:Kef-type K+ transport system membrane component KefB
MKGDALLLSLLVQLVVIIAIARVAAYVSRRLGQPIVVGEIMAGLILGPSALGRLKPDLFAHLFPKETSNIIFVLSQVGLVFLMYLIGLEFDFSNIKSHGKAAGLVSISGIVLPFSLGLLLANWMHPMFPQTNPLGFSLFMGTAISITAIPILGRIMIEFNLQKTDVGVLTITSAAIDDALGWICLAVVSTIVIAHFNILATLEMLGYVAILAIAMLKVIRPVAIKMINKSLGKNNGQLNLNALAILVVAVFLSASATNLIGISSLFGPFMFGACLYDQEEFKEAVFRRLKDFITVFFLPIFFTYTGLHTDMGSLNSSTLWIACGAVLFVSFFGKTVGCTLAARLSGLKWKQASAVGIMMNTRALMGLIAANIGLQMGVIPKEVFSMLVFMCAISTVVTSPILRRLIPGTEMEEPFLQSEYVVERKKMGAGRAERIPA